MRNAVATEMSASSTQSSEWHFIVLHIAARGSGLFIPTNRSFTVGFLLGENVTLMVQGPVRATAVSSQQLILPAASGEWDGWAAVKKGSR